MVLERSLLSHLRKQAAIWIYPVTAGTLIFIDWNHTRKWKAGEAVSVLDEIIGPERSIGIPSTRYLFKLLDNLINHLIVSVNNGYFYSCLFS